MESKFISTRRFELDWLRVFAILGLLFFHSGRIFNIGSWHIKNNEVSAGFDYWMSFLRTWRMPLLLFISGAGSYFAFKVALPFLVRQFKRLVVPLVFGMIALLPLQFYFEHIPELSSVWDVYKSFWDFFPFYNGVLNLYHLWFLQYLFLYSIIALPILIFLHSTHAVVFKTRFMRYFFNPAALLLVPPVLIMTTQLPFLPNHQARAIFVFYLTFYVLGIIFYCSSQYRERMGENRNYFLAASLLILIPFYLNYPFPGTAYLFGKLPIRLALETVVGWFWIITMIAFGQFYFNRRHPWLALLGEGIISFYILHQTVIVVIGYYVCKLPWSIAAKFWSINVMTLAICITFYVFCIRPLNAMRIAFGMKPKPTRGKRFTSSS